MTASVIVILVLVLCLVHYNITYGFRVYKYSRSVEPSQFTSPVSPCPEVFQYQNDESGDLFGLVKVDQSDPEGRVQLDIELSVGNTVQGYNGKIVLAEERQKVINDIMDRKPIYYRVLFPAWRNIPPKVTKISVNGNLICNGPRIPIQLVPVLTVINLQHKLSLGVTSLISSPDPSVDTSTYDSLAPVFTTQGGNQQNPQISLYDVRVDKLPNNIFAESFNPSGRPEAGSVSFPTIPDNPYNFNPSSFNQVPVPRVNEQSPSVNLKPSSSKGQINPNNPFLNGLSTPEPFRGGTEVGINSNNPFLSGNTKRPLVFNSQTTSTPPKAGFAGGTSEDVNQICGRPLATNSLIVNGQNVPRGAYPWLVAIFRQLENLSLNYICSGSLISAKHVLTAAHCVKHEHRRVKPNEIVCVFGKLNIRKWVTSAGERMLEPDSIVIHPDYEPGKANADIAIMTFADPIPFSKMIMPVCLWQGSSELSQVVGNIGTVVGWGRDENGDISTAEPRQVNMPIVDQLECLKGGSSIAGQALVEIVSQNTFCAGFRNGSGPCNGDSGSAFLLRKNGVFYLKGVVSTALSEATHRSCNLQEYVVFADASKYSDWIRRVLRQSGG